VRTGEITIREIVDRYMAEYAGRDTTRAQRLGWWVAKLGSVSLADLTDDSIYFALQDLAPQRGRYWAGVDADGKTIYKAKRGPLSPSTVNRYGAALGAVLTSSVKRRIAPRGWDNPCKRLALVPRTDERRPRALVPARSSGLSAEVLRRQR